MLSNKLLKREDRSSTMQSYFIIDIHVYLYNDLTTNPEVIANSFNGGPAPKSRQNFIKNLYKEKF